MTQSPLPLLQPGSPAPVRNSYSTNFSPKHISTMGTSRECGGEGARCFAPTLRLIRLRRTTELRSPAEALIQRPAGLLFLFSYRYIKSPVGGTEPSRRGPCSQGGPGRLSYMMATSGELHRLAAPSLTRTLATRSSSASGGPNPCRPG